jgi:hypothetical protein
MITATMAPILHIIFLFLMFFVIFETDQVQVGIRYTASNFTIHIQLEVHLSLYYSKDQKNHLFIITGHFNSK